MEKPNTMDQKRLSKPPNIEKPDQSFNKNKKAVWDCDSSLYDSFELNSFEKQLNAAISAASRSLSMPHLSTNRISPNDPQPPPPKYYDKCNNKKPTSKISRSFNRFIRSVFRTRNIYNSSSNSPNKERVYAACERPTSLTAIPESPEFDAVMSPDLRSITMRTASDRFDVARTVGISCS